MGSEMCIRDSCIDSGLVGIDGAIDMILKFIELKEKNMGKDI